MLSLEPSIWSRILSVLVSYDETLHELCIVSALTAAHSQSGPFLQFQGGAPSCGAGLQASQKVAGEIHSNHATSTWRTDLTCQ